MDSQLLSTREKGKQIQYGISERKMDFQNKKEYRGRAILRWKDQRSKRKEEYRKRAISRQVNHRNKHKIASNVTGRDLLQFIPYVADFLPYVPDCPHCGALKFYSETSAFCCLDGRIVLSNNQLPNVMTELLTSMSEEAKGFRTYIRTYNNHFAFTSFGVRSDPNFNKRDRGIYTFRVQGQVYHFINDLCSESDRGKNLQLYFHDTDNEIDNRLMVCPRISKFLVEKCMKYLARNPYAFFFRSLKDIPDLHDYKIVLKTVPTQDQRVYNKPDVSQVAAIWVDGQDNGECGPRDIQVLTHNSESRSIRYFYGCYDPLQYPLMFPFGELGWHQGILKKDLSEEHMGRRSFSTTTKLISPGNIANVDSLLEMEENVMGKNAESSRFVSVREYYAYKLQIRSHDRSCLLYFGRLLQQYIVDNYVKLETQRLDFYRTQQEEIRQEFVQGVVDAMANGETEGSAIGKPIVLPSSFIGGPRNMRQKYVDAMALVQKFGKPDIFLTITCNPNWPEIKENLKSHEEGQNRADLIVRVFHAKVEQLKHELLKNNIFGDIAAYTYVIEFQKRGLPHAHFLLILKPHSKMHTPEEYDRIVSAEIPSETANPHLFRMVVQHMFHGPCGSLNPLNVCMKKGGVCKNLYPKDFSSETIQTDDAYPIYRRRNTGAVVKVRGAILNNKWVVPYNAFLLCKFNCHINIEICSTIKAVKYIYKYICKGCDKISFNISSNSKSVLINEIDQYQSGRWVSPPEAAWRIFRFSMGEIKPAVIHLPLHIENYQPLTFKRNARLINILSNPVQRKTMLTEFFVENNTGLLAQQLNLTYVQFPDHFVWKGDKKIWSPRQIGDSIGRIVIAHPSEGERYYLRILLSKVRCPKSFVDLKTFNGVTVDTFREAALLRGYLVDDNTQELCMQEASTFHMPYELRRLFATLLVYTCPNSPRQLWLAFENAMMEDILRHHKETRKESNRRAFQQIDCFLQSMGRRLDQFHVLPKDFFDPTFEDQTREIKAERSILVSNEDLAAIGTLNKKQKIAFDRIIESINSNKPGGFFIDGPGGTGKTFLYRSLLAKIRSEGNIALATATSGIAASLLPGGRTAHSRFQISLDTAEAVVCKVSKQSSLAMLIRSCKLIIWDEAPMAKKSLIEALDRLLRDIMDSCDIFGGKIVVLGGDFRQTLPVVRKGTKAQTISACLTNSYLWPSLCQLQLIENMRARLEPTFTDFLLRVGNGAGNLTDEDVVLPSSMLIQVSKGVDGLDALMKYVYPDIHVNSDNFCLTSNRAVLTTKNIFVDEINDVIIQKFPGKEAEYISFDETIDSNDQAQYEDLLHSLTPNGMPPHKLVLKYNAPIILLRNMNPFEGLCNGTRLFCKGFERNVIRAEISYGEFAGRQVFVHRIPLQPPTGEQYTVPFKRFQFPVKLCFAMTINKAQGQTLDIVGVYLKEPVFSHGQLYVALSRAKSFEKVKVFMKYCAFPCFDNITTKNIVYKEVLECAQRCHM